MDFTDYLKRKQLRASTIKGYLRCCCHFNEWLQITGQEAENISYSDLLGFIEHCYDKGMSKRGVMRILGVVRHYYNYLKYIEKIKTNPAAGLYIKGDTREIPHDLLTIEQLEKIYTTFDQTLKETKYPLNGKRNKVMLGLMIYQGLTHWELQALEPHHLRLKEGKIEVPGTRKSNRRILKLESHQMIELQEYLSLYRPELLQQKEIATPKNKALNNTKLFISMGSSPNLNNSIMKLMEHLRKHYDIINAGQIRQSRIAIWVKHHDVRQVQYMAGHKYVSSTERYQSTNMEDLQKELDKHHPS